MKIMFVIPKMTGGGAERVIANLCNYWCRENNVRIVSIASDKSFYNLDKRIELCGQNLEINRKSFFSVASCYTKFFQRSVKFIKKNIKEFEPDCVISFLVETDILTYCALGKNRKIVRIFSERNDPTRRSIVKRLILKKVYKTSDLFVCQGKKVYDYYSYIPNNKKIVIPNLLNIKSLPKPELSEKNHDIVSVGRLFRQKNFALLIESFIMAVDKLPDDCRLIIYGNGPLKKDLQAIIEKNKMEDKIRLVGATNDVLDKISGSALFVMSSDYEGFPNALLEAMAVGLPVISTNFYTGVAKELIKKQNGIVVPNEDVVAMSDAMIRIMNEDNERREMRRANILVRDEYNAEKIGDLWLVNMAKIVRNRRGES